ncbi:hypothetical protein LLG34_00275, partial [bacterium]|nr:hypothetical protein [bacterium]
KVPISFDYKSISYPLTDELSIPIKITQSFIANIKGGNNTESAGHKIDCFSKGCPQQKGATLNL